MLKFISTGNHNFYIRFVSFNPQLFILFKKMCVGGMLAVCDEMELIKIKNEDFSEEAL